MYEFIAIIAFQYVFVIIVYTDYTKLVVIGGVSGGYVSSIEVIDLEEKYSNCTLNSDYPIEDAWMTVGIVDGVIKSCASVFDGDDCYDYDPTTGSWTVSTSLLTRRSETRSSFIDGVWLVSGDSIADYDDPYHENSLTTEIWTGTEFEEGPLLPIGMWNHCQLTVNLTHVFFADTRVTGRAFLLDWYSQTWTELPPMTVEREDMSCGLINNSNHGLEVVIVEDSVTEIYNFKDEEWRSDGPYINNIFNQAGFAQVGDTFYIVGGQDDDYDELDTIYYFDHIDYSWGKLTQRLQVPRTKYPGVVAVPDEFVTCS